MPNDNTAPPSSSKSVAKSTRSSIRHSLNLASVGKALADVINKDGKDGVNRRLTNKSKETQSRRLSCLDVSKGVELPRAGLEQPIARKPISKHPSPDTKTITQSTRPASSASKVTETSVDEMGMEASDTSAQVTHTRTMSTLRPRSGLASSALPKYRPKSAIENDLSKKPSSPARTGTRRKHSSSEDDKERKVGSGASSAALKTQTSAERTDRPISPIPRRASSKVILTPSTSSSASPLLNKDRRTKRNSPSATSTPTRPTKTAKSSSPQKTTALHRPHSASPSRTGSRSPRTPMGIAKRVGSVSTRLLSRQDSNSLRSAIPGPVPSPLGKRFKKVEGGTPASRNILSISSVLSPSVFSDGASSDSLEAEDVELLLATVASPTAPTPALPRILTMIHPDSSPQTPSRSTCVPAVRAHVSDSSLSSRDHSDPPSPVDWPIAPSDDIKGSPLSWHQLRTDTSNKLEEDVLGMISETSAPFLTTPGPTTPSHSNLQLDRNDPVSPSPYGFPSPGDFASISQVLLPNVTPSPAIHNAMGFDNLQIPPTDAAAVTRLRLRLASSERLATERLSQIQSMEAQLCTMKEMHTKGEQELANQISQLENHIRESFASRDRCPLLEEQLSQSNALRIQAVEEAMNKTQAENQVLQTKLLCQAEQKRQFCCTVWELGEQWLGVRELADGELELLRSNREMLAVLLSDLAFCQMQLQRDT